MKRFSSRTALVMAALAAVAAAAPMADAASITPGAVFEFDASQDVGGDATWTKTGSATFETMTFSGGATPTAAPVSDGTLSLIAHTDGADGVSNTYEQFLGGAGQASRRNATFEVWFKPDDLTTADQIIHETGGGGRGTMLTLNNASLEFLVNGDNSITLSTALTDSGWRQVVGLIQNAGAQDNLANDYIELYLDGAYVGTSALVEIDDWAGGNQGGIGEFGGATHPSDSQIAGGATTGGQPFSGAVHAYRYYDRLLTPAEIQANYDAVSNPIPEPSSLVAASLAAIGLAGGRRNRTLR